MDCLFASSHLLGKKHLNTSPTFLYFRKLVNKLRVCVYFIEPDEKNDQNHLLFSFGSVVRHKPLLDHYDLEEACSFTNK